MATVPHQSTPARRLSRVVVVDVCPNLLASTLERLLTARGWEVVPGPSDPHIRPAAIIVSPEAVIDLRDDRDDRDIPISIVLPDADSHPGRATHDGQVVQTPFLPGPQLLDAILELLGSPDDHLNERPKDLRPARPPEDP